MDDPSFPVKFDYMNKRNMFFRVNDYSWWKEELPSQSELEKGYQNLARHNFTADYVVTHCLPDQYQLAFDKSEYTTDSLTQFFASLDEKVACKQ